MDRLGEVHALDGSGGIVPNAQPAQVQMYASGGQPNFVNPSGLNMNVPGIQQAFTPSNTVTAASLTNLAQGTIPAADAETDSVYELEVWGNGQQGTIGNRQTLQLAVVLGGSTMASITFGSVALPDTAAAFRFRAVGRVICLVPGAAATWQSSILATVSQFSVNLTENAAAGSNNTITGFSCESTGTTVKDSTASNNMGVSAAWGATTGAPTLTSQVALFKRHC